MKSQPLNGIRVLELGQLLAGPFCGQLLGDFGAEVIKVEQPQVGDPMRGWGREKQHGKSLWWPIVARNKKSITCNLRDPRGQELLRDLVTQSDVLIENFRPGTLERWNLGYEQLCELNPKLVLVRVTGYGQTGPFSQRAGYGSIGEAMGGLRYVTGDPSLPPSRTGISLGDSLAGTFAALGTLLALHRRNETGTGQIVDSAIYEAVLALMESTVAEWEIAGYQRERTGAVLPNVSPSNAYPTADATSILIAANQDSVFGRLVNAMGRPELAADSRFDTHSSRGKHMEALDAIISEWSSGLDSAELLERLHTAGVPAGRIYRAKDMLEDEHFKAREAIIRIAHPEFGPFPMQNVFPRLSESPGAVRSVGPGLGEHNRAIYGDLLGLSQTRIKDLIGHGVI